jgi:DNA-binding XRE family transcriptional regulator
MRDASTKGRLGMQVYPEKSFFASAKGKAAKARGTKHHSAKLDEAKVREIRCMRGTKSQRQLAKEYGVDQGTISAIFSGRTWKHVV